MDNLKEHECASISMKMALWCSLPAALVCLGIIVFKLLDVLLEQQEQQSLPTGLLYWGLLLPVLLVTLCLSAAFLGRMAGKLIHHRMRSFAGAVFVGICLALGCLLSVIVMWIIYNVIATGLTDSTILGMVLLFSVITGLAALLFGSVPAILLGVLYGMLVRKRCSGD